MHQDSDCQGSLLFSTVPVYENGDLKKAAIVLCLQQPLLLPAGLHTGNVSADTLYFASPSEVNDLFVHRPPGNAPRGQLLLCKGKADAPTARACFACKVPPS